MAPVRHGFEISLAQRLASNERSVRSKALKTLRKYINLRSQKPEGGFTNEDLLKIWKGLFYCLWMQDKQLLQEEISHKISGLIHSFHSTDNQILYFATFLQTVVREWNGIDRLRMDKFFQLVRIMFRQVFEILKRREWESSLVNQFLQVFTKQLLQNTDNVPKGLMLHILDLYMIELAHVGSAELTAKQNLIFIDPFCKTMAKTKDRWLATSISTNIFKTIVDHAPYAIEDLIRELQNEGDDSESDHMEVEEEESSEEEELKNKPKKTKVKKVDGTPDGECDLDLDSMVSKENDVGPVLQFDYGAIADELFKLGSRWSTPNINRTMMYSLVKIFRDLSNGICPKVKDDDDCDPSDTSDEELCNNKKSEKKKRRNERPTTEDKMLTESKGTHQDDEDPSVLLNNTTKDLTREQDPGKKRESDSQMNVAEIEANGVTTLQCMKSDPQHQLEAGITFKKKRRSKALKTNSKNVGEESTHELQQSLGESEGEQNAGRCDALGLSCTTHKPEMTLLVESQQVKGGISLSQGKTKKKKKKMLNVVEEKMDREVGGLIVETQTAKEISLHSRLETSAVAFHKEPNARNKVRKASEDDSAAGTRPGASVTPKKEGKRKKLKSSLEDEAVKSPTLEETDQHKNDGDENSRHHACPASEEDVITQSKLMASASKRIKGNKCKKLKCSSHNVGKEVEYTLQDCCVATETPAVQVRDVEAQPSETIMGRKKIKRRRKAEEGIGNNLQVDVDVGEPKVSSNSKHVIIHENEVHTSECSQPKLVKKAKKNKQSFSDQEDFDAKKQPTIAGKKNKIQMQQDDQPIEKTKANRIIKKAVETVPEHPPEVNSVTPVKIGKKKRKQHTDEADVPQNNEAVRNEMGGKKCKVSDIVTPKKLKMGKTSAKSDFVSFQGLIKPPTPLFCKTKAKHGIKKFPTLKTENKKVTFGLKNNKTTEFRKTDRSSLVSPVGSSRVAFDPYKLPVSGVLKSPSASPVLRVKNKPGDTKRATAADFF